MVLFQQLTEASQLPTPGRSDLHNREAVNRSPMSTATQCASKLQALLAGHRNAPSDELRAVLSKFSDTLEASILKTVRSMSGTFCTAYVQNLSEQQGSGADVDLARRQLQMGETLFYKALESIVIELKHQKPDADLSVYLSKSAFQQSLFACCLEIVMFCYNSQREFPWILEKGLWREVIKHLNQIEEQILECHAWKDDSPLWDVISRAQQNIPQCKEVFPQWRIETFQESLRNDDNGNGAASVAHPSPGCSRSNQGHLDTNRAALQRSSAPSSPEASGDNKPPRCDSLALFFRKVYHLAAVRFFDMCERLSNQKGIQKDIQHKIWTCFEHSLVAHIDLMRDRHLDQLLMCALYVGGKVTNFEVYRRVYLRRTAGQDERDDVIRFYNDGFVKSFCSGGRTNDIVCLTPLPRAKYMLNSPKRQISPNVKLFVSPLKVDHFVTPERHTYHFSQSPAKDLLRINETVRSACVDVARKRILLDGDALEDKPPTKKHVLYEKIEAFVRGRQDT
ncbi:hypothetical protein MTO96_024641 [Rhipicephalus appendiculatus]